jgi:Right handed beta helix region
LPSRLVTIVVVAALAVGSWLVLRPRGSQPLPCGGVEVGLDDDLQEAIDGSPAGTTFCLAAGTYVIEEPIETKDGTELRGEGMGVTVLHSEGANVVVDAARDRDVAVSHLDLADAHGSRACRPQCGSGLHGGSSVVIDSVAFYDNENHGLGGAEDLVVTNSVFHHNGSRGFTGCCAGGLKSGSGFRIEDSKIYENTGNGLWCDSGCPEGMEALDNEIRDNTLDGIRYEVSDGGALIAGNVIARNNTSESRGGHGGIAVVASSNAEVRENTLGGNGHGGIVVADTARGRSADVVIAGNSLRGDDIRGCSEDVVCADND